MRTGLPPPVKTIALLAILMLGSVTGEPDVPRLPNPRVIPAGDFQRELPKLASELADLSEISAETLDGIARIERIVQGMRQLSPTRAEGFEPVDVNQVVRDALRLSNAVRLPGLVLEVVLADPLPRVEGAAHRLVQAIFDQ